MNYAEFKERTEKEFINYLPEEYRTGEVRTTIVNKTNMTLDGLAVCTGGRIAPTIYIQNMYEDYERCEDFELTMRTAADMYIRAVRESEDIKMKFDRKHFVENVIFQLVNTEANKELFAEAPHREFEDVSFIYRWIISNKDGRTASTIINNQLLETMGMDEEMLFRTASLNTPKIFPLSIKSMSSLIGELLNEPHEEDFPTMYVVSNSTGQYGASAIFYKDALKQIADKVKSDFYVIPSSIHEMLAVPVGNVIASELTQMIYGVNKTEVELGDRLSNELYFYDCNIGSLKKVSNTKKSIKFSEEE